MDDQPARGGAALAGGADRAEEHGAHRHVEVGVGGDDDGVVAAELEQRPAEAPGDHLGDAPADRRRPGEGDERQAGVGEHPFADGAAGADDQGEDAGHAVIGHHLVGDALHRQGGERRRLGRLPHHRVAADGGDRRVPRPDGDREVEGGDDPDRPERMPLFHHPVPGPLGRDGQPVELTRQAGREVADVDHLLHFAVALGADLAHLERDQIAQRLLGVAQRLARGRAPASPRFGRRHRPPGGEGGSGRVDRAVVVGVGGQLHRGQGLAGARVVRRVQGGVGGERPVARAGGHAGIHGGEAEPLEDGGGGGDVGDGHGRGLREADGAAQSRPARPKTTLATPE